MRPLPPVPAPERRHYTRPVRLQSLLRDLPDDNPSTASPDSLFTRRLPTPALLSDTILPELPPILPDPLGETEASDAWRDEVLDAFGPPTTSLGPSPPFQSDNLIRFSPRPSMVLPPLIIPATPGVQAPTPQRFDSIHGSIIQSLEHQACDAAEGSTQIHASPAFMADQCSAPPTFSELKATVFGDPDIEDLLGPSRPSTAFKSGCSTPSLTFSPTSPDEFSPISPTSAIATFVAVVGMDREEARGAFQTRGIEAVLQTGDDPYDASIFEPWVQRWLAQESQPAGPFPTSAKTPTAEVEVSDEPPCEVKEPKSLATPSLERPRLSVTIPDPSAATTSYLPTCLNGRVTRHEHDPITNGGYSDVYRGNLVNTDGDVEFVRTGSSGLFTCFTSSLLPRWRLRPYVQSTCGEKEPA